MLLMDGGAPNATLMDFERIFHQDKFRKQLLEKCSDRKVVEFWTEVAEKATWAEISLENVAPYIVSKLTQANQSLSQVDGRGTHNNAGEAALANAANLVVCRVGAPDAKLLSCWFEPDLEWHELCRLPDFYAAIRALDDGRPVPARTV